MCSSAPSTPRLEQRRGAAALPCRRVLSRAGVSSAEPPVHPPSPRPLRGKELQSWRGFAAEPERTRLKRLRGAESPFGGRLECISPPNSHQKQQSSLISFRALLSSFPRLIPLNVKHLQTLPRDPQRGGGRRRRTGEPAADTTSQFTRRAAPAVGGPRGEVAAVFGQNIRSSWDLVWSLGAVVCIATEPEFGESAYYCCGVFIDNEVAVALNEDHISELRGGVPPRRWAAGCSLWYKGTSSPSGRTEEQREVGKKGEM
ncbi:uncharacterized protein LOC142365718 [Opisthocomus hoazin]|uniref:uncharacterized protein LOC142365718 n=1 Tax=Opisthocomus hoazin TaxID=30419 RepID=UPI003F53A496